MAVFSTHFTSKPAAAALALTAALALAAFGSISHASAASAAEPGDADFLGTAETFVIIASDTVTVAGVAAETVVNGDVALTAPNPVAMKLTDAQVQDGDIFVAGPSPDPVAVQARLDLTTAYNIIKAADPNAVDVGTANLALNPAQLVTGVYVYTPGTYNSASDLLVDGNITLDGLLNPDSVFVFQASTGALTVGSNSQIILINGAQACNVYWQVGSSATIGSNSQFVGTVLAGTSITAVSGATIQGQLLASALTAGAVTLDENVIDAQTTCVRTTVRGGTTTVTSRGTDGEVTTLSVTPPPAVPGSTGGTTTPTTTTTTPTRTTVRVVNRDRLVNTGSLANTAANTPDSTTPLLVSLSGLGVLVGVALLIVARTRRLAD